MIRLRDARLTFAPGTPLEVEALRGLSLTIAKGEFVSVIGSNGAGKSTLLNVISGETELSEGNVVIDGEDVTRWPAARRAGYVARVFQDPRLGTCEGLTIAENLALAADRGRRRGFAPAIGRTDRDLFRERLSRLGLGLENRLGDPAGALSGGQRQALALVMATLRDSRVLLLDEHTAALDPRTAAFVMERTGDVVAEQNLTALMVTHSMRQALDWGTRTVMLHEGKVVLDVAGEERSRLGVNDLIEMFHRRHGGTIDSDALLIGD